MNILRLAHSNIRSKFHTKILASFLYYGGLSLMFWADWRVAVGFWLVVSGIKMEERAR
jgi:hypothetical protein